MQNINKVYDVAIIGGGPAGYTAAIYGARAGLDTVVIEKLSAGGQMTQTMQIDNYPGFDEGVDGFTLGAKMQGGAERFGAETIQAEVLSVDLISPLKALNTSAGEIKAKCVIVAAGAEHRALGIESEKSLVGRGVGYCAACDGMFYKGKNVVVVGGGNSAAADALLLSKICNKVTLVHRRDSLRAEKFYQSPLLNRKNIEFCWNSVVTGFVFDEKIKGVKVENVLDGKQLEIPADGVFISIGRKPNTELFKGQLDIDDLGYIKADESTQTGIDGVFAVGDVRTKAVRQIVTAVADGANAIHYAQEYLSNISF